MHRVRVPAGILAIVFGLLLLPSMASALNFQPGTGASQSQVGQPSDVATGDFNNDGLDDLAVASGPSSNNGLNVALATGGGSFGPGTNLDCNHTGTGCFTVVAGQFTGGDSDLDLFAVPFQSNSQVLSFVGNGTGVFVRTSANAPTTPNTRESIAVGDLNGNSVGDIVFGASTGTYVVGIAQGPGTFSYSTGAIPGAGDFTSATMGDFNDDGDSDVALGDNNDHIFVLLGDGGGGLTYTTSSENPASTAGGLNWVGSMVSADFNGDGRDDVGVTAEQGQQGHVSSVQTFLGTTDGNLVTNANPGGSVFSPTIDGEDPNTFSDLVTADFDQNGVAGDLAYLSVKRPNGPTVYQSSIRLSDGAGSFTAAANSPFAYNQDIFMWGQAQGDFNGDGAPDLVGASPGGGSCSGCGTPVLMSLADASAPSSVDFGGVLTGTNSAATTVTINNTGAPTAHLSNFSISGPDASEFSLTSAPATCDATVNSPCARSVTFSPASDGTKSAILQISNADGPNLEVFLSGTGTSPAINFAPSSTDFGELALGLTSAPQTVTVTSSGTAALHIGVVAEGTGDTGDFNIVGNNTCSNATLAPNATCEFNTVFAPSSGAGIKSLDIEVPNDSSGAQATTLQGVATDPGLDISPVSGYTFADAIVGGIGQGQPFTITSTGTTDLKDITKSVTGPDASDFSLTTGNCSGAFAPTQTCSFTGIFHPGPADHAIRQATFEIRSNAAASPTSIAVSGTALVGDASLTPTTDDFGDVRLGQTTASKTITFKATGTAPVAVDEVGLNGPDSGNFSRVANGCNSTTIPAGGTCQVVVNFTPSLVGELHGELKFATDAGNFYAQLSGNGINPVGSLTPASHDFGSVTLGDTSAAQAFTIQSTGDTPLEMSSGAILGDPGFVVDDPSGCTGSTLAPTQSCSFTAAFKPTGDAGSRSSTLTVGSNAGSLTSTLTGTATAVSVPPKAKLSLKAPKKVKKGKKLVVTTKVKGLSAGAIAGIVVAAKVSGPAKAPKKVKISSLGQGKTKTIKLKVPVKKSAKPGKKVTVTVTVTSGGKKLATARVKTKVTK